MHGGDACMEKNSSGRLTLAVKLNSLAHELFASRQGVEDSGFEDTEAAARGRRERKIAANFHCQRSRRQEGVAQRLAS